MPSDLNFHCLEMPRAYFLCNNRSVRSIDDFFFVVFTVKHFVIFGGH